MVHANQLKGSLDHLRSPAVRDQQHELAMGRISEPIGAGSPKLNDQGVIVSGYSRLVRKSRFENFMAKPAPVVQPIELDCVADDIALQMTRWLSHKKSEAYARDVRQCLAFLAEHWGTRVTLAGFAALEASDIRAFMAMRR